MRVTFDMEGAHGRRIMVLRLGSHLTALALVTGLGLFLVGEVESPWSWMGFTLATFVALLIVVAWSRAVLIRLEDASALDGHGVAPLPKITHESEQPRSAASPVAQGSADDVDYLMALRHEFRTPLNAVLGFSDVLLSGIDGRVNASQREDLEIIRASGIRLRILLDSALDLSQLADGELRLETEGVDVCEIVRRAAVEVGQLWSNKRFAHCTLPGQSCMANVDEARLRRSILVLADFLATNHRDAQIQMSLASSNGHLAIELTAQPSDTVALDELPTPREVLASEDIAKIRRWPVAVTSEVIAQHHGSLYHGSGPSRFLIRLPAGSVG
ncbi:MAG: hypothetical protein AMJ62_10275 [Myxococcales bacterium SG8_38]|nr:MAG: hypothetical protein AMJ62_10275 [Myxococcales bacterium SG8_38]